MCLAEPPPCTGEPRFDRRLRDPERLRDLALRQALYGLQEERLTAVGGKQAQVLEDLRDARVVGARVRPPELRFVEGFRARL